MGHRAIRLPAAAMLALGALCGWRSVRVAFGLARDDAGYHFRQWEAQEYGAHSMEELDRAMALDPRYTAAWIAKGLAEEAAGERASAEAALLHAAQIDKTYLPRWTLANFYFRAGNTAKFWMWARRAAEMAYEPDALFGLCWRASGDATEILERAIPPGLAIRREYFDFLLRVKRWTAAEMLVAEIGRSAERGDLERLLAFCDGEIVRHEAGPAIEAWNALIARGVIPYSRLDPGAGAMLTNGDLIAQPLQRGFDWRAASVEGAALSFDPAAHEMTALLEGRQPEFCDFVEQYVPVGDGSLRLRYRYRTRDLGAVTGFGFRFLNARTGAEFANAAIPASPEGWGEQTFALSPPKGCAMIRIILQYRRPVGKMRAEGSAVFNRFFLERAG